MPPPGSNDIGIPHWAKKAQTDHVILRPWPLTLEVMAPVPDAGRRFPSVYQVWSSYALPFWRYGARCVWALMGLMTLTFDLLNLKLVCESHQRWGTFLPNLGTPGLWLLELFAMYATDGRTDRRTDGQKQRLVPLPYSPLLICCHSFSPVNRLLLENHRSLI